MLLFDKFILMMFLSLLSFFTNEIIFHITLFLTLISIFYIKNYYFSLKMFLTFFLSTITVFYILNIFENTPTIVIFFNFMIYFFKFLNILMLNVAFISSISPYMWIVLMSKLKINHKISLSSYILIQTVPYLFKLFRDIYIIQKIRGFQKKDWFKKDGWRFFIIPMFSNTFIYTQQLMIQSKVKGIESIKIPNSFIFSKKSTILTTLIIIFSIFIVQISKL